MVPSTTSTDGRSTLLASGHQPETYEHKHESNSDVPDQKWSNPFSPGTWLYETYDDVIRQDRDIVIIVDDYYARRGTGKSVASLKLIDAMDQTEDGITNSKATTHPEELRSAYEREDLRSGLLLDEAELGASNRDAMTNVNKSLREIMSIGRVEQKYVVVNSPLKSFIDKDIQKLADVWISMVRKGLGLVHSLRWEPYSENLLTPRKQWIAFDDIPAGTDLRKVYNHITKEKRSAIAGEEGNSYIPESEHKEQLKRAKREMKKRQRNEVVKAIVTDDDIRDNGVTHSRVANAIGLSQSQVSNIVNGT